MTREDKVLHELQEAFNGNREYFVRGIKVESGWVPNFQLLDVDIGAVAGLRALRRLKPLGYRYERKQFVDPITNHPISVWLYKLISPYPDLTLAKDATKAMKKSYVKKDVYMAFRERMNNCTLCGKDGAPKGMIIVTNGVKLCECHPNYKKKTG